ncbi:chaperonin 10-like protein [Lipomyces chichibuensis]|uniref:chaperonin 10-like protein n=1 Tax=Lipomyces chichibuensis TaxID=1546026 RepID=UPI0033432A72
MEQAVGLQSSRVTNLVQSNPFPGQLTKLFRDDYILVQTVAVALNPTDWKHIDFLSSPGALVGCDYAGIVKAVGPAVMKTFKEGDRVCGCAHGSNSGQHEDGTFAEYIVAKGDLQMHIPDQLSFEEAATLGVGVVTVGQGLYEALQLPLPSEPSKEKIPILIYGGSSSTGSLGIQFAKLSGYDLITTCSPHNFDLVKSLGAVAAFDYKDPKSVAKIRNYTSDNINLAWDTISLESSAKFCADVLSPTGGKYACLLDVKAPRNDVETIMTSAYTAFGEPFEFGPDTIPAIPERFEFAKNWVKAVEQLLFAGKIKVPKPKIGKDGLNGVLNGLQLLRENKVSGEKLVYRVNETR